jgi:hypothetical protein
LTRHVDGAELFLLWRKNDHDARGTRGCRRAHRAMSGKALEP